MRVALLVSICALFATGCAGILDLQTGPAFSTSGREGHNGVAIDSTGAIGVGEFGVAALAGFSLRTKFAKSVTQGAIAPTWSVVWGRSPHSSDAPPVGLLFNVGFNFLQLERVDGRTAFGMFSPWTEAHGFVRIGENVVATLGTSIEYDLRFAHGVNNEGYACILAGIAVLTTESL